MHRRCSCVHSRHRVPRMNATQPEREETTPSSYIRRARLLSVVRALALVPCSTVRIIFRRERVCVNSRPRDPPRLDRRPSSSLFRSLRLSSSSFRFLAVLCYARLFLSPVSFPFLYMMLFFSVRPSVSLCFSADWNDDETTGRRAGPHGAEWS